jgi:phage protein D
MDLAAERLATGATAGASPGPTGGSPASPAVEDQTVRPTAGITVEIDGRELDDRDAIAELNVKEDVEAPSMFTLRFTGDDALELTDKPLYNIGGKVKVTLDDRKNAPSVFTGEITGLEIELTGGGVPSLTVRGYDRRHRLLRGTRTRTYAKMSDSAIAAEIAERNGLTFDGDPTEPKYEQVLQHGQTDLEFLKQRAARIGYEVVVEDMTLYFRPHKVSPIAAVTLSMQDVTEFYARMSAVNQPNELRVRGWDPRTKRLIDGVNKTTTASDMGGTPGAEVVGKVFGKSTVILVNHPVFTEPEAQNMARGQLREMALGFISGEGTCNGRTDLKVGMMIELTKLGKRFTGAYYVLGVEHTVTSDKGLITKFTVRRSATEDIARRVNPPAELHPKAINPIPKLGP